MDILTARMLDSSAFYHWNHSSDLLQTTKEALDTPTSSKRYIPLLWEFNTNELWSPNLPNNTDSRYNAAATTAATATNGSALCLPQEGQNPWSMDIHKMDQALNGTTTLPLGPPTEILVHPDAPDDVSLLNDDPDHDDDDILPQPTFDVLATLFQDIYKDDSEVELDSWIHHDTNDYNQGARAA